MKKMFFALNPSAGKGAKKNEFVKVCDTFIKSGYDLTLYITQKAGELPLVIQNRANEFEVIAVWGGDGTLNEAVNGLALLENKKVLGYLPKGTTNDFAHSLSIPDKALPAASNICTGIPYDCDMGRFNGRFYSYVAGFGAFTSTSYSTSRKKKKLLGHLAYVIDGFFSVFKIRTIHAKWNADGNEYEDDLVYGMVSNTKSVGGFKIPGMDVITDDGYLELMTVKMPKSVVQFFKLIGKLLSKSIDSPFIKVQRVKKVTFEFDGEIPWTLDGEFGGSVNKADIEVCHKAISIIIPR